MAISFSMRPAFLMISFRDHEVITLQRTEKYSYTDFLAICGGLLGLFLGASVLSVIEFTYYSTLRLYWTLRQRQSRSVVVPLERHITSRTSFHNYRGHHNAHRMRHHRRYWKHFSTHCNFSFSNLLDLDLDWFYACHFSWLYHVFNGIWWLQKIAHMLLQRNSTYIGMR